MRACALTDSASVDDMVAIVGAHLFARGLVELRLPVSVGDGFQLPSPTKAAQTAQAVTFATTSMTPGAPDVRFTQPEQAITSY